VTQRLRAVAQKHWVTLDGEAAGRGFDLLQLPFDRFLNTVYRYATKGAGEIELAKYDQWLWMPPPGVVATRGPWSPEAETAAFRSLKAALGIRDPSAPPPQS
jgi:hypothetical protein